MGAIFLVRHGQTVWNREEVFRGTTDIELDSFGRLQAEALGKRLSFLTLENPVFVASPLIRAKETAELAAAAFPCAGVKIDSGFTDLDFGSWQGKSRNEVMRLFPEDYRKWLDDPGGMAFPGGESLEDVSNRAMSSFMQLANSYQKSDLVIVTHRVVNKVLLCTILGADKGAFWKIRQDTACINILDYDGSSFVIDKINETCHLDQLQQKRARDF